MRILLRVFGNFLKDTIEFHGRAPVPMRFRKRGIQYQPRNVVLPNGGIGGDVVRAEVSLTPARKLRQRDAVAGTTADIEDTARFFRSAHLPHQQRT